MRFLLRAARRVTGGAESEVNRGISKARRQLGSPAVALASNSALGFSWVAEHCPQARTVLWLHNVLGRGDVPGLDLCRSPTLVIANSAYTAHASEALGWTDATIHTVLNGVDTEAFFPRTDYLASRANDLVRVLLLGRIDPNKGFHRALDALERAHRDGSRFEVALAGPLVSWGGDARQYLDELTRQLAALGGRYLGSVNRDALPALVRGYDVMIVPSLSSEPFGLVALEAMASGLAVIASNRGGLPEACGGAGVLVDPEDIEEFASAIRGLSRPDVLRAAKQAAVQRARTRTWDHAAADLVGLLGPPGGANP
jgi:glycosyltransferase involved in cell wall biosynthesis